jgi:hypothetical protein
MFMQEKYKHIGAAIQLSKGMSEAEILAQQEVS